MIGVHNIQSDFLSFANGKSVHKRRHRFWIVNCLAAGDDQRVFLIAISAVDGQSSKIQDIKEIGVEGLVRQADADDVEIAQGTFVLQAVDGNLGFPQGGFHIRPRRKGTLRSNVISLI